MKNAQDILKEMFEENTKDDKGSQFIYGLMGRCRSDVMMTGQQQIQLKIDIGDEFREAMDTETSTTPGGLRIAGWVNSLAGQTVPEK